MGFLALFGALAYAPLYRQDWLLENLLVFVALALLIATRARMRFSNHAYTLLFVFLVLHEIRASTSCASSIPAAVRSAYM